MQALVLLPEWECNACTATMKISRGCVTDATNPITLDGELMVRCPRRPLLDRPDHIRELFWLYSNYVEGILPQRGGLDDQPVKLMASIRLLKGAQDEAQREKTETDRKRSTRMSNY